MSNKTNIGNSVISGMKLEGITMERSQDQLQKNWTELAKRTIKCSSNPLSMTLKTKPR